jgi:hypothetical protein
MHTASNYREIMNDELQRNVGWNRWWPTLSEPLEGPALKSPPPHTHTSFSLPQSCVPRGVSPSEFCRHSSPPIRTACPANVCIPPADGPTHVCSIFTLSRLQQITHRRRCPSFKNENFESPSHSLSLSIRSAIFSTLCRQR